MYKENGDRRPAIGVTQEYLNQNGPAGKPRPRCRMAHGSAPGSELTGEQVTLLAHRLRVASLILAVAFCVYFVRHLLESPEQCHYRGLTIGLSTGMTIFTCALAGFLWMRRDLCGPYLRFLEIALFGSMVLYFAFLQVQNLADCYIMQFAVPGREAFVIRIASIAAVLRWVILVVLYGTFIPNTWRRCALVVGSIAVLPILINAGALLLESDLRPYWFELLFDTTTMMTIAATIAVFGSYKINILQREAVEAKKLGQYVLKAKLGSGGMGEVYLGEHTLLRRPCAIKLIRPDQAGDPANLIRFEREVRATATLTHWNTVEIFDYGHTEDGTFYYVMEYLPGLSLQEIVDQYGPLPPERAIHFLHQLCGALREAHGIGLVHRDIKPSNILACERGGVRDVAKLLDFGLVQCTGVRKQDVDKLTMSGTIVGSPQYMSPEQARGQEDLDARTDIYSLGGVAYFLLTGKAPFERDTAMQIMMAHAYEPLVDPNQLRPEIPPDLHAVIVRCLEKDPAKRFQDADSLDKALAQCAGTGAWTLERSAAWWQERASDSIQSLQERPTDAEVALAT